LTGQHLNARSLNVTNRVTFCVLSEMHGYLRASAPVANTSTDTNFTAFTVYNTTTTPATVVSTPISSGTPALYNGSSLPTVLIQHKKSLTFARISKSSLATPTYKLDTNGIMIDTASHVPIEWGWEKINIVSVNQATQSYALKSATLGEKYIAVDPVTGAISIADSVATPATHTHCKLIINNSTNTIAFWFQLVDAAGTLGRFLQMIHYEDQLISQSFFKPQWTPLTLSTGIIAYQLIPAILAIPRGDGYEVHMRGAMSSSSFSVSPTRQIVTITTIPESYRPVITGITGLQLHAFAILSTTSPQMHVPLFIDLTTGTVTVELINSSTTELIEYIVLNSITYFTY
jgi:hypothetical protein